MQHKIFCCWESIRCESNLAEEAAKASEEEGPSTIRQARVCFVPWAAYEYPCNSWACICHAAVARSYVNILCVDIFGVSGSMKAVNKIVSTIQAAGLQPGNVRNCLSTCCPLVFEIPWRGAARDPPLAFGLGPAVPPLPSGWDLELLLSPGLAGTGRLGLEEVLLALP